MMLITINSNKPLRKYKYKYYFILFYFYFCDKYKINLYDLHLM